MSSLRTTDPLYPPASASRVVQMEGDVPIKGWACHPWLPPSRTMHIPKGFRGGNWKDTHTQGLGNGPLLDPRAWDTHCTQM